MKMWGLADSTGDFQISVDIMHAHFFYFYNLDYLCDRLMLT